MAGGNDGREEEKQRILDDSFTSKEISAFFRAFRRRVLISFILDERFFSRAANNMARIKKYEVM